MFHKTRVTEIIRRKNRQYGISHGSEKCWVGHIITSHRHLFKGGWILRQRCFSPQKKVKKWRFASWWLNQPIFKNMSQIGFIFPNFRGEKKKYVKPPTSLVQLPHFWRC